MSNTTLKYPAFDFLETQVDLEYSNRTYEKLQPVAIGQTMTDLVQHQPYNFLNGLSSQQGVNMPYLNKILVIYFYSRHWGDIGLAHLKQLNAIRNEVKYHDGSILIIDGDGAESKLQQLLWSNNLSLKVYADPANHVASLFKVFSENSPAWNYYTGIDANAALPATFVLNHFLRVTLAHANKEIDSRIPADQIVNAVYQSNHYQASRISA